jgi:hypothetical protein
MKMRLLSVHCSSQVLAARRFLPAIAIVLLACLAVLAWCAAAQWTILSNGAPQARAYAAMAELAAEESDHARFAGEPGPLGVEIEAADAFEFQDDVVFLELGDRQCHGGVGWRLFTPHIGEPPA